VGETFWVEPRKPGDLGEDPDNDGLTNLEEYTHETNPKSRDSDGDHLPNGEEVNTYKTDPNDPSSVAQPATTKSPTPAAGTPVNPFAP